SALLSTEIFLRSIFLPKFFVVEARRAAHERPENVSPSGLEDAAHMVPQQAGGGRREARGESSREEGDVSFDVGVDGLATGGEKFVRWTVGSFLDDRLEAYPTCRDGVPVTD
ncbi:MAG: hypothetical protein ACK5OC_01555, partial [Pirellula sp.]